MVLLASHIMTKNTYLKLLCLAVPYVSKYLQFLIFILSQNLFMRKISIITTTLPPPTKHVFAATK